MRENTKTSNENFQNELYEITETVQAKVQGAHLLNYNPEEMGINPCLDEKRKYWGLIFYWLRGEVKVIVCPSHEKITIGNVLKKYTASKFERFVQWMASYLHN